MNLNSHHDYYDATPLVCLDNHVCIVGHRGARSDAVVRYLGAYLGLNYALLDDAVAHELGESPVGFIGREGLNVYRYLEAKTLAQLTKRRPNQLFACSSDVLARWWTRRSVLKRTTVVWLEMPLDKLLEGARQDQRLYPGLPAYILLEHLQKHCEASWQGKLADIKIDCKSATPSVLAHQVIKAFGWSLPQQGTCSVQRNE